MIKITWGTVDGILDYLDRYNEAINKISLWLDALSPSSNPTIIDFHDPLYILGLLNPRLLEEIKYRLYDCPNDWGYVTIGEIWKDYLNVSVVPWDRGTLKELLIMLELIDES